MAPLYIQTAAFPGNPKQGVSLATASHFSFPKKPQKKALSQSELAFRPLLQYLPFLLATRLTRIKSSCFDFTEDYSVRGSVHCESRLWEVAYFHRHTQAQGISRVQLGGAMTAHTDMPLLALIEPTPKNRIIEY